MIKKTKQNPMTNSLSLCFSEKRFFEWRKDTVSVTLREKSGSYGGGSEVLVLQRRFSDVIIRDTDVSPTLEAGGGPRRKQLADSFGKQSESCDS